MSKYTCVVVEDDSASRFLLCDLLKQSEKYEVIRDSGNPLDAFKFLSESEVDVVFLDVEMPEMSGIGLAKLIPEGAKIVITTSEEKYAVDAFGIRAFDFILKPVDLPKLLEVSERLKSEIQPSISPKPVFLKTKGRFVKIDLEEVIYVQAFGDYINYFTRSDKYTVRQSMNKAKEMLGHLNFVQVHRSYIVNLDAVDGFESDSLMIGSVNIPISRSHKDLFQAKIKKIV